MDDELRKRIDKAQALVRKYVPKGTSLTDELIKERREEAANEAGETVDDWHKKAQASMNDRTRPRSKGW